jgi:dihydrofolate reductase
MGKLVVFDFISLNGFFKGLGGDLSWAHGDEESDAFAIASNKEGGMLLFGRVTYEMMAGFWPTSFAQELNPALADGMNKAEKVVFSRTLAKPEWNNTRVVKDDMVEEIKMLKQIRGKDMTILGSGSIVNQLAEEGLIDEYQIMIHPIVLEGGTPILSGIKRKLNLNLISSRVFKSGKILLFYEPVE